MSIVCTCKDLACDSGVTAQERISPAGYRTIPWWAFLGVVYMNPDWISTPKFGGETRALIGGGGEYSYIRVLPDEFLLKSAVIKVNFKRNSLGRTRRYEYSPPPPN